MSLAWKLNRLRSMGVSEILYRAGQFSRTATERMGIGRALPAAPGPVMSRPWLVPLPTGFEHGPYVAAADSILKGRYTIFALERAALGFPPDWNRDPRTGTRAPLTFGKSLNYRDEGLVGNIKYLWEPNRHLEFVTLAQAWHLSGEQRFVDGCRTMLESWFDQCPYPFGPNWTSSLELGIRLVNWSFGWHLLGGERSPLFATDEGQRLRRRWLDSVYQHCAFIAGHLSKYSSGNNHLLGEQLGLFVAAVTWPAWPEADHWRDSARADFQCEALLQNAEDGVNREQATWYHHEVADMMLIAGLVGRANGVEFNQAYWIRLERMLEFLASIMDVGGNVPAWGDSDDAVVIRFDPQRDFHAYRSLLATGAVLFNRDEFKTKARLFDDKSRWMLGDAAALKFESISDTASNLPIRRAFPSGGYYILGSDFETDREIRIVADVGPLGYLSTAAHGHADALSFTLSVSGREVLIDPGTYSYHTDRKWRDYFRGTSAHNTLCINDHDQSASGGSFLWVRHAHSRCHKIKLADTLEILTASHDGYDKRRYGVTHRRTWTYDKNKRILLVDDELNGKSESQVAICWHFSNHCKVQLQNDQAVLTVGNFLISMRRPVGMTIAAFNGSDNPPAGWISRRFDAKEPTQTVILSQHVVTPWRARTTISISEIAPTSVTLKQQGGHATVGQ